jgi:hypothetical protein
MAFHLYNVASLTPCLRHTSAVLAPASYLRRISITCFSVKRDPFIAASSGSGLYLKLAEIGGAQGSAKIVRHGRSITFQMAEVMVSRGLFQQILDAPAALRPLPQARC